MLAGGRNRCRFAILAQLHLLQASVPANFCEWAESQEPLNPRHKTRWLDIVLYSNRDSFYILSAIWCNIRVRFAFMSGIVKFLTLCSSTRSVHGCTEKVWLSHGWRIHTGFVRNHPFSRVFRTFDSGHESKVNPNIARLSTKKEKTRMSSLPVSSYYIVVPYTANLTSYLFILP